jgi:hypothetical protein
VLLDHVAVETRPLIDAEHTGDAADHASDDTADHGADRSGGAFAVPRAAFNPARDALGLCDRGKRQRACSDARKNSHSDKTAKHDYSPSIR